MSLVFKKDSKGEQQGNYSPASFTSISGNGTEQFTLNDIYKQLEEKKVVRSSQCGSAK